MHVIGLHARRPPIRDRRREPRRVQHLVVGWALLGGQFAFPTAVDPAVTDVGFAVALAAAVAVLSGVVAIAHEVVADG